MDLEDELSNFFETRIYSEKTQTWLKARLISYIKNSKEVILEHHYTGFGRRLQAIETTWPLYLPQFNCVDDFLNYPSGNMIPANNMPERYQDLLDVDLFLYMESLKKEAQLIYKKNISDESFSFLWNYLSLSTPHSIQKILGQEILTQPIESLIGELPAAHKIKHWQTLKAILNQLSNQENLIITLSFSSFAMQVTGQSLIVDSILANIKRAREFQVGITIRQLTNLKYDEMVYYKRLAAAMIDGENGIQYIDPKELKNIYTNDPMSQEALGITHEDTLFINFNKMLKILKIQL